MKAIKFVLMLMVPALMFTSCATIIGNGGPKQIPVQVNEEGYDIFINGILVGTDTSMIEVKKGDIVTVEKDGFKKSATQIQGKFNGWVIGNLVFGGIIGIVVDVVTNNTAIVTTPALNVKLKKEK